MRTKKTKENSNQMHELPPDHPLEILRRKQVEKIKAEYPKPRPAYHGTKKKKEESRKVHMEAFEAGQRDGALLVESIEEVLRLVYGKSPSSLFH